MIALAVIVAVAAALVLAALSVYNGLITRRNAFQNA